MSKPETYLDVSAELLEELLLLNGLGVRIVGARTTEQGVVRFYIEGPSLPAGPMRAEFHKVSASTSIQLLPA